MKFDDFMNNHLLEIDNYIVDMLVTKKIAIVTHATHVPIV